MADYRRGARRCPGCGELLAEREQDGLHVDVCPACAGVWIDWMDGDLRTISAKLDDLPRAEAHTTGAQLCPVCRAPLVETRFGDDGPLIHRCGDCAGAFVPRSSLAGVAGVDDDGDETPSDPLLTRVMDALGEWLLG